MPPILVQQKCTVDMTSYLSLDAITPAWQTPLLPYSVWGGIYPCDCVQLQRHTHLVYYISMHELSCTELRVQWNKPITTSIVGWVDGVITRQSEPLSIQYLHVNTRMRGHGLGTCLLASICLAASRLNTRTVALDDYSDQYRNRNNIYLRVGFIYTEQNDPAMIGNTHIVGQWAQMLLRRQIQLKLVHKGSSGDRPTQNISVD
jgi:hypothetical protein